MSILVAIHQPNFFPWLGYFDKIRRADVFVFLDAVSYPRSGSGGMGSWCNRVRIAVAGEAKWITCPLCRAPLGTPILATEIDDSQPWRTKLMRTLEANYRRYPGYMSSMAILEPLIRNPTDNLAEFNMAAVKAIATHLGLSTRFVRQSELDYEGQATQLLASIVKAVGGSAYLAGGGAAGYQEDDLFTSAGIELVYQGFSPQPYGPAETFLPGLSVIDFLIKQGDKVAEAWPQ